ncbi:histidinol dehydrogenase [Campylobacter insulaenigrae]|uniref:histidinol dehydrogenase n=1 Tax=Campylobacter insulaenigrae TaxID=260714 RepID=UPI002152E3F2|nr:histidinol dehydrogenase [Campylobacter insulaenigrae]MCR6572210.1 histidinol dehydrogenase [Campylobacter insulaenigrae]
MQILKFQNLNSKEQEQALKRPAMSANAEVKVIVEGILKEVKEKGDEALKEMALKFDKTKLDAIKLTQDELENLASKVDDELKMAIQIAYENIYKFHKAQESEVIQVQTFEGVTCKVLTRAIEKVGLYIPGGLAPLFSTALMLAIPAKIAKCKHIALASPAPLHPAIAFVAKLCDVDEVYQMGGAGAIAAFAYGTQSVVKVDKIFGPGNAFVTEAKKQVNNNGVAIDMQAGPSEVLVLADEKANAKFIASDLLSQAEHGVDSQALLVCVDENLAKNVFDEVFLQLEKLSRKEIAKKSIENSKIIIAKDLKNAIDISNQYAPEHLIIHTQDPHYVLDKILHAGSVFLGEYSPESMGDYASGTNHVLPTYGLTKAYSSLGLADFMKRMTVQELSKEGFKALGPIVEILAAAEGLDAHKNAVSIRLESLK